MRIIVGADIQVRHHQKPHHVVSSPLMDFIPYNGYNTLSLRQIDAMNGLRKGSAFRAFKYAKGLEEGVDYFYVPADDTPEAIADWRQAGLIYPATVNVVLITESGYHKLQQARG